MSIWSSDAMPFYLRTTNKYMLCSVFCARIQLCNWKYSRVTRKHAIILKWCLVHSTRSPSPSTAATPPPPLSLSSHIPCALKLSSCLVYVYIYIFNRWLYPVLVKISLRFFIIIIILYFDCLLEGVLCTVHRGEGHRTHTHRRIHTDESSSQATTLWATQRNDFHFMTPVNRFIEPYLFILIFCQFSCTFDIQAVSYSHSHILYRYTHSLTHTHICRIAASRRQHNLLIKSLNKHSANE